MLIFQDPSRPNLVLDAVLGLASPATTRFRAVVAYTTQSGCQLLAPALATRVGVGWDAMLKTVITSFDYGITEPDALEYLVAAGFEVRIANLGADDSVVIIPSASAFHPKAYIFDADEAISAVVGSANLTRRAMTVNVEAAYVATDLGDVGVVDTQWDLVVDASVPLTDELLQTYRVMRPVALQRPRPPKEPIPPPQPPLPGELRTFAEAVLDDAVDPEEFAAFWVEAGSMSSSASHAQLELPRHANTFFGYAFDDYDDDHHVIGEPLLVVRGSRYDDRRLTWHGNNRMERINLPTNAQSGLTYPGTAICFRRLEEGFSLEVQPWNSPKAQAWRAESAAADHAYRLGQNSDRICGLI